MSKLNLLFTKDGLQYQITRNRNVLEENAYFVEEESSENLITEKLEEICDRKNFNHIAVFSAFNHFTVMPSDFVEHDLGYTLIRYNADVNEEKEELMLSVNRKFGVQFYYTFPKNLYQKIKSLKMPVNFNFAGEKFLNTISSKFAKEIHINLYHHQCEFLALERQKLVLYNNLDVNSEVDFLYFIMFTISKIGFDLNDTHFLVYGEISENDTFISELKKFVKNLKIVHQNSKDHHFVLA